MSKNKLSGVFSGIAPYYDLLNHILSFNNDKLWRKRLVDVSAVKANSKILDLCAGTADISIEFAKRERSCRVFGVDFSGLMLNKAGEKIKRSGLSKQISLIEADVLNLPFKAGYFDVVSIGFGLRNLIDHRRGIVEAANMLKKGGRFFILEFSPPDNTVLGRAYTFYLKRMLPLIARIFGGSLEAYRYLSSSIAAFIYPKQILNFMEEAGLKKVYYKKMCGGIVNLYSGEK
jgi:demethylmenaquinone methyltransferase/2-methoxy-6-polyprenyl-1,4-benzoquinol methylase